MADYFIKNPFPPSQATLLVDKCRHEHYFFVSKVFLTLIPFFITEFIKKFILNYYIMSWRRQRLLPSRNYHKKNAFFKDDGKIKAQKAGMGQVRGPLAGPQKKKMNEDGIPADAGGRAEIPFMPPAMRLTLLVPHRIFLTTHPKGINKIWATHYD